MDVKESLDIIEELNILIEEFSNDENNEESETEENDNN